MDEPDNEGSATYDFAQAWGHRHAFAVIKAGIQKMFMMRDDFNPENPYEELSATITTTGMIHSAYELGKNIEIRYGWELLDDENIIMHSCFGVIEKIDIRIGGQDLGFLMDIGDDEFGAFKYKDVYWVCEAEPSQFK